MDINDSYYSSPSVYNISFTVSQPTYMNFLVVSLAHPSTPPPDVSVAFSQGCIASFSKVTILSAIRLKRRPEVDVEDANVA
jgi:hypothetical protein